MSKTLKVLQDRLAATRATMSAMLATITGEDREFSADEQAKYTALDATLQNTLALLESEQRLQQAERTMAPAAAVPGISVGAEREVEAPFASLGEQLQAIANVSTKGVTDPRLFLGAATGGSAAVGADGGFLIRKEFSTELFGTGFETGLLASRCSVTEIGADSDGLEVVYVDETSRATGSRWGGVQVYRRAEAETVSSSKPAVGKWELRLEDIWGLAYMTDRLLADAGAMQSVYREAFASEFGFKLDDEIIRGNGAGQCQGVLNAAALVTITKEQGQANDTVVAENVMKMWERLPLRSRSNAVWFINHEVELQLQSMQIGTGTSAQLVYMPAGGLSGLPYGTIYGRPVLPIEQAPALGDAGDVMLLDLSQYKLIRKGGLTQDESMHVRFLYGEKAFRWQTRVNGAPKLKSAITPYKGTKTLSPFIALGAR